jgi:hypothetical protein
VSTLIKPFVTLPQFELARLSLQVPTFGAQRSCYDKAFPRWPPREQIRRSPLPSTTREGGTSSGEERQGSHCRRHPSGGLRRRSRQQQKATPEGTVRTCSSEGTPHAPPPGFAHLEGKDIVEDGEIIGISAEGQLKLRALRIKNNHLQKQKEILEAKRQHITMQAKIRQMILDEEQKARELEQQIADIQGEGPHHLQHSPLITPTAFQGDVQGKGPYHLQRSPLTTPSAF